MWAGCSSALLTAELPGWLAMTSLMASQLVSSSSCRVHDGTADALMISLRCSLPRLASSNLSPSSRAALERDVRRWAILFITCWLRGALQDMLGPCAVLTPVPASVYGRAHIKALACCSLLSLHLEIHYLEGEARQRMVLCFAQDVLHAMLLE